MPDKQLMNMRRRKTPVVVQSMTTELQAATRRQFFLGALLLVTQIDSCPRALHNPNVSQEAKQHAKEVLKEHDY